MIFSTLKWRVREKAPLGEVGWGAQEPPPAKCGPPGCLSSIYHNTYITVQRTVRTICGRGSGRWVGHAGLARAGNGCGM